MQVLLVLFVLGWLTTLPAIVWWVLLAIVLIALVLCGYFVLDIGNRVSVPWKQRASFDPSYVAALETMASEAQTEVEALRAEVDRLRSTAQAVKAENRAEPAVTIHRRVGLADNAPEWLVAAARRAYRSRLHPDRHPAWAKEEAEARFKEAEQVFEQITAR